MLAKFIAWLNERYPLKDSWQKHFVDYKVPDNLNFWYCFGVLALFLLGVQFVSGIWLMFFYTPTIKEAFASIEIMMREVHYGWLLRYLHTTGASLLFVMIYAHIFRSILYGSYKKPRELIWVMGVMLYFLLLIEALCGYILPWGQMSYWAAQVLTSSLGAWIKGDTALSSITLHRFFTLHVIVLPVIFTLFIKGHLVSLRKTGSNNPTGNEAVKKIPFHPTYTIKDIWAILVLLFIFAAIVFFSPDMGGYFLEANNFVPANPLQTPAQLTTPWYIAPFYGILRYFPNKTGGFIAVGLVVIIVFLLPWLDRNPIKLLSRRALYAQLLFGVAICGFIFLGYLGLRQNTLLSRPLYTVLVSPNNKSSLQRGAKLFFNYCSGCHSLRYSRYQKLAEDAGIMNKDQHLLTQLVKENLIFNGDKLSDVVKMAMPIKDAQRWFGIVPPDLSLIARVKGANWLYTYLKSFYRDLRRPWGTNNSIVPNVMMPNVLLDLQGEQIPVYNQLHQVDHLVLIKKGHLTPQQFNTALTDIVNFLVYVSDISVTQRQRLGGIVLLYLLLMLVLVYFLRKTFK